MSAQNDCEYCQTIHGAIAAHHLGGDEALVDYVKSDHEDAPISDKLSALLTIARKTALGGQARHRGRRGSGAAAGATDLEIHDTVLIAAVFCLCNRYVDGLATWAPRNPEFYRQRAAMMARTRVRGRHDTGSGGRHTVTRPPRLPANVFTDSHTTKHDCPMRLKMLVRTVVFTALTCLAATRPSRRIRPARSKARHRQDRGVDPRRARHGDEPGHRLHQRYVRRP